MGYSNLTDMEKLIPASMLINLSNDSSGAIAVDQANIDEAIDQADREIDAYLLLANYSVPMDPVPPLATNLSAMRSRIFWQSRYVLLQISESKYLSK